MAEAIQADRTAVANLLQVNQALTQELSTITTLLKEMKSKLFQLESKMDKLLTSKPTYNRNSDHYCWSHGRTFNPNHTSKNCRFRKPGHKEEATLSNRMEGNDKQCSE